MKTLLLFSLLLVTNLFSKDVILDTTTSLLWQDAPINKDAPVTYKEAQSYCKYLKIGKYKDFRLPSLYELQSIVDYKNYDPAILGGFKYVESTSYWTSTPFADDASEVWTINFEKGTTSTKAKYYDRHFRCVLKLK
ncbi:Lcl C-terminal domain-containing protein [Sulfurimonas sp.]